MKKLWIGIFALCMCSTQVAIAAQYSIEIQNLTRGIYFTPLLVAAHTPSDNVFESGSAASTNLQSMAEGGDIAGLESDLTTAGATIYANPAGGLLTPGASTTAMLDNGSAPANTQLSIVGMMLPTNDGFVGMNSITLPTQAGVYSYWVNGYDAGTEANDEIRGSGMPNVAGFPVPPPLETAVDTGGTGYTTATAEGYVHIHRGVLGDTNSTGGISDIDSTLHRWLNPVARVTVTVTE